MPPPTNGDNMPFVIVRPSMVTRRPADFKYAKGRVAVNRQRVRAGAVDVDVIGEIGLRACQQNCAGDPESDGVGATGRIAVLIASRSVLSPLSVGSAVLLTVMVAAEAWRQNDADIIRARMLKERFIGVWGKPSFLRCSGLEALRIGHARVLPIVEKPPFFVSWNPRCLIVDFCVPAFCVGVNASATVVGPHRGFAMIVIVDLRLALR